MGGMVGRIVMMNFVGSESLVLTGFERHMMVGCFGDVMFGFTLVGCYGRKRRCHMCHQCCGRMWW